MVPAGRRLSRVDSKTLRESFTGQDNAEMEAVMRNLARKDDKIKYNRRMRVVLAAAVGVMVIMVGAMFAVTLSANEATKESHVSRSNAMVGLDGKAITTAKDTAYVKLAELSRASLEYLSNLEDITLVSKGKVHQFRVTGYTLHDSDNLDLHTSTSTMIKIQCGAVRIVWDEGKFEDADDMHAEAKGAARQLSAMSASELQEHYEAHASASTRKLAASNPLQSLYAFFGGMAKSSANSELYGALAPVTGCKKPAAIISFARPTIPEHSKWTVEVNKATKDAKTANPRQLQADTWYMSWDTASAPSIRFESPTEDCQKAVNVDANGVLSSWQEYDSAKCMGESKFTCPTTEELKELKFADCAAAKAAHEADMARVLAAQQGAQEDCTESAAPSSGSAEGLKVRILDVKTDGSALWQFGGFTLEVDIKGNPTAIVEAETNTKYEVTKIEPFMPSENANLFKGCKTAPKTAPKDGKRQLRTARKLGWMEWLSNTDWCGAGTNLETTKCPGTSGARGDPTTNHCCRRHDHGKQYEPALFDIAVKLECQVDKDLAQCTNNWAAQAAFGTYGAANVWGCHNYAYVQNCWWHWAGCGWRGCPGWQRRCSGSWKWESKYGPWRYDNINNRGVSKTYKTGGLKPKTCSGDLF